MNLYIYDFSYFTSVYFMHRVRTQKRFITWNGSLVITSTLSKKCITSSSVLKHQYRLSIYNPLVKFPFLSLFWRVIHNRSFSRSVQERYTGIHKSKNDHILSRFKVFILNYIENLEPSSSLPKTKNLELGSYGVI